MNRGSAYGSLGQWDKAIADCSKAIGINPGYAKAYYSRGAAYCNLGQWEKAAADFSRVIEIDPDLRLHMPAVTLRSGKCRAGRNNYRLPDN